MNIIIVIITTIEYKYENKTMINGTDRLLQYFYLISG